MKKSITVILLAIFSIATYAQEKNRKHDRKEMRGENPMERFTPEQRNTLIVKQMTLDLDLNSSQQKEISKLLAEQNAKRDEHFKNRKSRTEKPTAEEIFELKNKMLDEKIEHKAKMKKILNSEQFKKWEESKKFHQRTMRKQKMNRQKKNK